MVKQMEYGASSKWLLLFGALNIRKCQPQYLDAVYIKETIISNLIDKDSKDI